MEHLNPLDFKINNMIESYDLQSLPKPTNIDVVFTHNDGHFSQQATVYMRFSF